jgi:hypothetical protein
MISLPPGVEGKGTFRRGVHPAEHKALAAERAIEVPPTPSLLSVPVLQNVGAPIEPLIQPKQEVAVNEKIGEASAFISAPAHSPVHGTVGRDSVVTLPNGRHVQTLSIQPSEGNLEGRALWDDIYSSRMPWDRNPSGVRTWRLWAQPSGTGKAQTSRSAPWPRSTRTRTSFRDTPAGGRDAACTPRCDRRRSGT